MSPTGTNCVLIDRANDFRSVQTLIVVNATQCGQQITDELKKRTLYDVSHILYPNDPWGIQTTVERFRRGNSHILVALHTEAVVAMAKHVYEMADLIVHLDMPSTATDYIKRVGHPPPCPLSSTEPVQYVINFVTPADKDVFREIHKLYKFNIKPLPDVIHLEAQYDSKT
ncbi:hypothetical protein BG004_007668 [Podila humilis]|nr:hypothetical protein BG004_007668 [Podila humilis]